MKKLEINPWDIEVHVYDIRLSNVITRLTQGCTIRHNPTGKVFKGKDKKLSGRQNRMLAYTKLREYLQGKNK